MLQWFTTIPGLLVICGIVLLIAAAVLFVMGNKDKKVAKPENLVVDNNNMTAANTVGVVSNDGAAMQPLTTNEVVAISTAPMGDDMITSAPGGVIDFTPNNGVDVSEVTSEYDFSLEEDNLNPTSSYDFSLGATEPEVTVLPTPEANVETNEPTVEAPSIEMPAI